MSNNNRKDRSQMELNAALLHQPLESCHKEKLLTWDNEFTRVQMK